MKKCVQVDNEVVVLSYEERANKITLGNLRVLPVGLFFKLLGKEKK